MSDRAESIKNKIIEAFKPIHFDLINESHMHSGPRAESHFKIFLVSDVFKSLSRVERQRLVNECLKGEFEEGLHALSMRLKTTEELQAKDSDKSSDKNFTSPDCSSKS